MVPTASMEGTVLVGDHYFVFKLPYGPRIPFTSFHLPRWRHAQRGEILAFRSPRDAREKFVKRVVAVGGDAIEIRNGIVYVNDLRMKEPYAVFTGRRRGAWTENMPRRVVPVGELFMLGDNRDKSEDSRFWGAVPEENIVGRPIMIFWSYNAPTNAWMDENPFHRIRFYASVGTHLFSNTRWSRLGSFL